MCFSAIAIAAAGITAALLGLIGAIAFEPLLHSAHEWKSKVIGATCVASVVVSSFAAIKVLEYSKTLKR